MKKINFFYFLILILIIFKPLCHAEISDELKKCKQIKNNSKRLVCYDNLTKIIIGKPNTKKSKWNIDKKISPIDDKEIIYFKVDSENIINTTFKQSRPSLIVRCKGRDTDLFVNWGVYLGLEKINSINRFDKKESFSDTWFISTDNKSAFAPSPNWYLYRMLEHKKLLIQMTPHGENPETLFFDVSDFAKIVQPYKNKCHLSD